MSRLPTKNKLSESDRLLYDRLHAQFKDLESFFLKGKVDRKKLVTSLDAMVKRIQKKKGSEPPERVHGEMNPYGTCPAGSVWDAEKQRCVSVDGPYE